MAWKNTDEAYGAAAKSFHWVVALLVIGLLVVGLIMTGMERGPDRLQIYGLHKSFGIVVLMLVFLRIGWKIINVDPMTTEGVSALLRKAARMTHYALYMLTIIMPLSGWAMTSAAGLPVSVFGLVTLPDLVSPDRPLRVLAGRIHEICAWMLIALIGLHIAAALWHHFIRKDNTLRRMLPG